MPFKRTFRLCGLRHSHSARFINHKNTFTNNLNIYDMTKREIAEQLFRNSKLTRTQSIDATNCLFDIIGKALINGQDVTVRGFATFKVVNRKQRTARNIIEGTPVVIPAHKTVKIIPSPEIEERMNIEA